MKTILQKDNTVLRQRAKRVLKNDVKGLTIKKIIKEMREALNAEEDGVALAAPQIGISLQIFVISPKIFQNTDSEDTKKQPAKKELIYINPIVRKLSRKKELMDEGCLSVRGQYGKVKRAQKITVEARNERGEKFQSGASGLLAQIFQHEIDHLNGILFTDKADEVWDVPALLTTKQQVDN